MGHTSIKSVDFAGASEYVNLGNIHAYTRIQAFSVSFWFKTTQNVTGVAALVSILEPAPIAAGWEVYLDSNEEIVFQFIGELAVSDYLAVRAENTFAGDLNNNNWHHCLVTYDGSSLASGVEIYIDGVNKRDRGQLTTLVDNLNLTAASTANLNFARRPDDTSYYIGKLDDISIWDKELTQAEAYEIWSNHEPNPVSGVTSSPNLVGWWKMGDLNSDIPAYSPLTTSIQIATGGGGDQNEAPVFPDPIALPATGQAFSMGAWFKGTTADRVLVSKCRTTSGRFWGLWFQSGRIEPSWSDNNFDRQYVIASGSWLDGAWHHVVWTYDGTSTHQIYVDGSPVSVAGGGSQSGGAGTTGSGGEFVVGGVWTGASLAGSHAWYLGRFCHSFLYDKVLSAGEVAAIYGAGVPQDLSSVGPAANLKHWCACGDGDALGAGNMIDLSGEGNHGTFINGESNDFVLDVPSLGGGPPILKDWQTQIATTVAAGVIDQTINGYDGTPTNMEDADFADALLASELMPDLSGNGYAGTPTNMEDADFQTNTPGGRSRRSSLFDGVNEYITMGNVLGFEYTDSFSFSAWIKTTGNQVSILSKLNQPSSSSQGYDFLIHPSGYLEVILSHDTSVSNWIAAGASGAVVNDGAWHHVVVTWNGSGVAAGLSFYLDGVNYATDTIVSDNLSASIISTAPFEIGRRYQGSPYQYFNGNIDDVTVYDKTLTLAEVQDIYNGGLPKDNRLLNTTSNIVGYWLMGDLTAGGCSHFATRFDGVNEYVTMGNVLGFEYTNPFSLVCWIKTTGTSGYIISKMLSSGDFTGYGFVLDSAGRVNAYLRNDNSPINQIRVNGSTIGLNDGNWHHIIWTWNGNVSPGAAGLAIYVDGIAEIPAIIDDSLSATIVSAADFTIGMRNGSDSPWDGVIDEVAIYARELTATEAAALYNNGVPIDVTAAIDRTDLAGYWRMGEGDGNPGTVIGSIVEDSSIWSYAGALRSDEDAAGDAVLDVSFDGGLAPSIGGFAWAGRTAEASIEVTMQAVDSITSDVYTWIVPIPDFIGEHYPGPNNPTQIAIRAVKGFP